MHLPVELDYFPSNIERFQEDKLKYHFKDKLLLVEALTHPSYHTPRVGDYQVLDWWQGTNKHDKHKCYIVFAFYDLVN